MNTNKKTGIYIPARLDSKRLPNKLILPMGDSCLFDIACNKLNQINESINKYVLINDKELIEIASKYPNIKIIIRDEETCRAETPLKYIFKDILDVEDEYLMFLNPCLSQLTKETIEDSIKLFNESDAEYATSVKEYQNWILDKEGNMLNEIDYKELTTKKIKPIYQFAHCFHIFNKNKFAIDGLMLKDGFLPIPIDDIETIDVDDYKDYLFARWLYESDEI